MGTTGYGFSMPTACRESTFLSFWPDWLKPAAENPGALGSCAPPTTWSSLGRCCAGGFSPRAAHGGHAPGGDRVALPGAGTLGCWEDLSLDYGDTEYTYRIHRAGDKILVHCDGII